MMGLVEKHKQSDPRGGIGEAAKLVEEDEKVVVGGERD